MTDFLARYMDPELAGWVALALIALAAIIVVMVLIRTIGGMRERRYRANNARLAVIDAEEVDGRRRLVLVRRDGVEHLLMIGGPTDIVVESGIGASPSPAIPAASPTRAVKPAQSKPSAKPDPQVARAEAQTKTPTASVAPVVTPSVAPRPETRREPTLAAVDLTEVPAPAAKPAASESRSPVLDEEIQDLLDQMGQRSKGPANSN